jgi:hypothetical protein
MGGRAAGSARLAAAGLAAVVAWLVGAKLISFRRFWAFKSLK